MKNNLYVLSLGGSLFCPDGIDESYVKQFKKFIELRVKKGDRFIIITGGGSTCRRYQANLKNIVGKSTARDLDWMGIYTTRFHAEMFRLVFGKLAHPKIVTEVNDKVNFKEKLLVAGGWIPGRSTDDDAVRLAKVYGSKHVINMTNVDYVYTADPNKDKNAKKIESMTWNEYIKVVGSKWNPGANFPFDPIASKFAKKEQLIVHMVKGTDFVNLANVLDNKKFKGTILS